MHVQAAEKGFTQPSSCDGLLEVVAFKSGYHAGVVMAGGMHAVRLAQAAGVRMRVRGTEAAKGEGEGMGAAYIQLDGEPWKQNVPGKKSPESEALQARFWGFFCCFAWPCMVHHLNVVSYSPHCSRMYQCFRLGHIDLIFAVILAKFWRTHSYW